MKIFLRILIFIYVLFNVNLHLSSENLKNNEVLYVSVNGLVCDFCARSIEKIFKKQKSVQSIGVDLEKMLITIYLKDGKNLSNELIKQLILDSGYEVVEVHREVQPL